jgi:hypothetical protein
VDLNLFWEIAYGSMNNSRILAGQFPMRRTTDEPRRDLQKVARPRPRPGGERGCKERRMRSLVEAEALKLQACLKGQILWKMDMRHRDFAPSREPVSRAKSAKKRWMSRRPGRRPGGGRRRCWGGRASNREFSPPRRCRP